MRYKFVKTIISASILSSLSIGCFSSALAARTNYYPGWYSEGEHFFFFDEDNNRIYDLDEVVYRGFLGLSERTNQIDAAVGAIDGRVTNNTQSINKNNKAIASNTRTLQQHSARLDKQQRQINENHKEMKRAAAQSAALTGLFQPYSVGKFNATAAVGGYSDQQAMAVGVGYRFNEQTAAKAGVAFSDGDASWNVGVNFEF